MRKLLFVFLIGVFLIASLTVAVAESKKEIHFLAMEYVDWNKDWYEEKIAEFEKLNPDIKVNLEIVSWVNGFAQYTTLIRAGSPPDVGTGGAKWTAEFKAMDALEPFDSHLSPELKDDFVPSMIKAVTLDGKIYALPWGAGARALLYNKTLFSKAGITEPVDWNWDDFLDACAKLKEINVIPFSINLGDDDAIWHMLGWLYSAGGSLVDDKNDWALNQPNNVDMVKMLVKIVESGFTQPGPSGATREDNMRYFASGKAAMTIDNAEIFRMLKENPELDYGLTKPPAYRHSGVPLVIDTIFLFKGPNQEAAVKWIEYLYSDDVYLEWTSRLKLPGGTYSNLEKYPTDPGERYFTSLFPEATMYPVKVGWDVVEEEFKNAVQSAILGMSEPQQALDNAQQRVEERVKF